MCLYAVYGLYTVYRSVYLHQYTVYIQCVYTQSIDQSVYIKSMVYIQSIDQTIYIYIQCVYIQSMVNIHSLNSAFIYSVFIHSLYISLFI